MNTEYKKLYKLSIYCMYSIILFSSINPSIKADVFENNPVLELSFIDIPQTFDNVYANIDGFNVKFNENGLADYSIKFHFIFPTPFDQSEFYYEDYMNKLYSGRYVGASRERIIGTPNFVFFLENKNYNINDIEVYEFDKLTESVYFKKTAICVSSAEPCNYFGRSTPRKWFSGEGYIVMWKLDFNKQYTIKIGIDTKNELYDGTYYEIHPIFLLPYKQVDFNKLNIDLPNSVENVNSSLDIIPYSTSSDYNKLENPITTYIFEGVNKMTLSENYVRSVMDYSLLKVNINFKTESWYSKKFKEYQKEVLYIFLILLFLIIAKIYTKKSFKEIISNFFEKKLEEQGVDTRNKKYKNNKRKKF